MGLRWRDDEVTHMVVISNPHSVFLCRNCELMRQAHRDSDMTLPDGVGIILAANILGYEHAGRVTGASLVLKLCDWGRTRGLRHLVYGGAPGVADSLVDSLTKRFPGLDVVGTHCPPYREIGELEDDSVINMINETEPDIVWVGLGAPKQEVWMLKHQNRIKATAMIGVGAAFDFHSCRVKWAPAWVRSIGIEWLWRTIQEPKRMWRRNLNNSLFLALILGQRARAIGKKSIGAKY